MSRSFLTSSRWRLLAAPALIAAALAVVFFGPGRAESAQGQTRTYYVAADEVAWDYAPSGSNQITGQPFGEVENTFVENGADRIGKVYVKALFREYTSASFATLKPRPAHWQHLGMLGPLVRAEVGDTIVFLFKNNTGFPVGVHPHGVQYQKDSEGAPYNDGTSGASKADDAVPPGETHTYTWKVPDRAGPGPSDPSSIPWMYHGHFDEVTDTNAGLIGPMIVTRRGAAKPDGAPNDVDRELFTMFSVTDENASQYLQTNIDTYTGKPATVKPDDDGFVESNLMHSINGYVYGNLPGLTATVGKRVRWHLMGMGTEVDLHTPHWHGQTVLWMEQRTDVIELLPASMKVVDMNPDVPGTWLFHCHVNDHIIAGMQALFTVST